jgi:hypothetical protein
MNTYLSDPITITNPSFPQPDRKVPVLYKFFAFSVPVQYRYYKSTHFSILKRYRHTNWVPTYVIRLLISAVLYIFTLPYGILFISLEFSFSRKANISQKFVSFHKNSGISNIFARLLPKMFVSVHIFVKIWTFRENNVSKHCHV